MKQVVVISGGSDGIGLACGQLFARAGWIVYELSRTGKERDGIRHITADVTDRTAVGAAFEQVRAEQGRLDVLIANAGFGISGAAEFTDPADIERLFFVNVLGADNCARAAIPMLRESRGKILFTGSVAGAIALPFQVYYSMSKAALNSLALGLANELRPFGVSVCSLMLGDAKTGFTGKRYKQVKGAELYGRRIERSVSMMEKDEQNGMAPEYVAKRFYRIAVKKHPKPLYTVGFLYKVFVILARLLPVRLLNWLVYLIYGR